MSQFRYLDQNGYTNRPANIHMKPKTSLPVLRAGEANGGMKPKTPLPTRALFLSMIRTNCATYQSKPIPNHSSPPPPHVI
jgi:hypothetical protein